MFCREMGRENSFESFKSDDLGVLKRVGEDMGCGSEFFLSDSKEKEDVEEEDADLIGTGILDDCFLVDLDETILNMKNPIITIKPKQHSKFCDILIFLRLVVARRSEKRSCRL